MCLYKNYIIIYCLYYTHKNDRNAFSAIYSNETHINMLFYIVFMIKHEHIKDSVTCEWNNH